MNERPWVKLPANKIPGGVRLWSHQGEPYAKFVRVAYTPSGDTTRNGKWSMVLIGGLSGLELSIRIDSPHGPDQGRPSGRVPLMTSERHRLQKASATC